MPPLSKSKLLAFRQCPKRLWLEVHRPELREDSESAKVRFQAGHEVGTVARQLYDPDGTGSLIDAQAEGFKGAFARTQELIKNGTGPVFEAGFQIPGALAFADVMLPAGHGTWKMVEVKSTTSVKDYHQDDIAIQSHIARTVGVNLKSVSLAHIDSSWVYPGGEDYQGLLVEQDLTASSFARSPEVTEWINDAQTIVAQPEEPEKEMGAQCSEPFECGFCGYCAKSTPQPEFPLDWLPRLHASKRKRLEELGVNDLRGAPDDLLNPTQVLVKKHTIEKTVFFDAAGAAADLAPHGFPAFFLDFETINFALPIWAGTRPYQQIPFQFSVHVMDHAGKLTHSDFLALSGCDPSRQFAEALILQCGQSGPVYVYNQAFESSRIAELSERFADLAAPLEAINARIVDLLPIARARYYHPSQCGSWSIKAVLPAAVPELSYETLDGVQNGDDAMIAFVEAINPDTAPARKAEIGIQLRAYCKLDTFAMVRLWQFFSGHTALP